MKKFLQLYKIEMKLSIREFSGVLFGMMLPVGIMLLLGILNKDQVHLSVPAVMTIGICASGLMGIPITMSGYREKKLLRRFQVTPTSPFLLLMVQFFSQMTFALVSTALVIFVAFVFFAYQIEGHVGLLAVHYFVVLLSIYSIGLMIASVSKSVKMANLLCTLAYFPMFFLSGATIPYEIMPKFLQNISGWMPLTQGIKLLKDSSLGLSINNSLVFYLVGLGVLCIIVSIKTFRYDY